MKTMISRVFTKRGGPLPMKLSPWSVSSELSYSDIENYYLRIILDCLRRMLVSTDSIEIDVRPSGTGPTGLPGFSGYVRIIKWDPVVTPVLLQNMSVVDTRIRKVADASVILEHTHFAGIWFQATSSTEGSPTALLGLPCELIHQPGTAG
ncbi:MAG: hypothetical protein H0X13_14935 [Ramlibacter sp.]|nr:hypothetical protein [Ramlibacter sp.]